MIRLTEYVHNRLASHLQAGNFAIDATAGNGHDTLFLSQCVGPSGRVFAFDIQAEAITQTRQRLLQANADNVELFYADHAHMHEHLLPDVFGRIGAAIMNLGFLPGGDRSIITLPESTQKALKIALEYLAPNGVVCVVAYRGHTGGQDEFEAVKKWFNSHANELELEVTPSDETNPSSPILFWGKKRKQFSHW